MVIPGGPRAGGLELPNFITKRLGKLDPMKIFLKNTVKSAKRLQKIEKRFMKLNKKYGLDKNTDVNLLPEKAREEYREILKEAQREYAELMESTTDVRVIADTFVMVPMVGIVTLIERDTAHMREFDKEHQRAMAVLDDKMRQDAERLKHVVAVMTEERIKKKTPQEVLADLDDAMGHV